MASSVATLHRPSRPAAPWRAALVRHWPMLAILALTVAMRAPTFGNPVLDFDEQLYLTVGDRMLHGQLPYVDMWDRKPIGLFAIYALIRLLLGGDGVIQYQIVAAGCVFGTAALVFAMARRTLSRKGALVAAAAYIMFLNPLHGPGGQSSVIYNLFTAAAAWATLQALDEARAARLIRLALLAMAMAGLAIQCKYTPVVEGCYFGLVFLWRFRRAGMRPAMIAAIAAAMMLLALAPTLAALGWYWWIGHLDALIQANFLSTVSRHAFPPETRLAQRVFIAIIAGPALAMATARLASQLRGREGEAAPFWFAIGWLAAALAGFGMLGDFYDFYFITVVPPLVLVAAPLADRAGRLGFAAAFALVAWPFLLAPPSPGLAQERRAETDRLVAAIRPYVAGGRCLYVYDGPTSLYLLTRACVPTRFIYPDHLNNPTELPALGVDGRAEEARLLATRPGAIVVADRPVIPRVDPGTRAILLAALKRDYVRVARVEMDRTFDVFALKALHPGPGILPQTPVDPR